MSLSLRVSRVAPSMLTLFVLSSLMHCSQQVEGALDLFFALLLSFFVTVGKI